MLHSARRQAAVDEIHAMGAFATFEWHESLDSTNKYFGRLLRSETPPQLPALVVAEKQSAGVGRGGNQWFSPDGCLMFSMAVPLFGHLVQHSSASESTLQNELLQLPLRVGIAIAGAIQGISRTPPQIKWPNDVYVEDRKIAGVLIETVGSTVKGGSTAIIGIGINCRVDFDEADSTIQRSAVSLHELSPRHLLEKTWTESVLIAFLQQWQLVGERQEDDPNWLQEAWPEWDWLFGKLIEVRQPQHTLSGRAMGIDEQGALLVQDITGSRRTVLSGTVRVLE